MPGVPVRLNARGRNALRVIWPMQPRDPTPFLGLDVRHWQRFGTGLVHGQGGLDLYFDQLLQCDLWQRDLTRLPREAAVAISRALAVGDRAFSAATAPDERGLLEGWRHNHPDPSWWWSRVPARGPLLQALLDQ